MADTGLATRYRAYIDCLNRQDWSVIDKAAIEVQLWQRRSRSTTRCVARLASILMDNVFSRCPSRTCNQTAFPPVAFTPASHTAPHHASKKSPVISA
ncbi:hypothetical protein [Burkholderia pyrrocinia]|uniref:hypothetical protein n=1 Tax=Burkholderia pyrrocinia TaxID=60550 RepID=UPI0030D384A7